MPTHPRSLHPYGLSVTTKRSVLLPSKRCNMRTPKTRSSCSSLYCDGFSLLDEIKEAPASESDDEGDDDLHLEEENFTSLDEENACFESGHDDDSSETYVCDQLGKFINSPSAGAQHEQEQEKCPNLDQTRNPRQQKSVRFAEGVLNKYYIDFLPILKSEYEKMWYQRVDYLRFRHESSKLVHIARESSTVSQVYNSCASSKKLHALTRKQTLAVSQSAYRGLETAVLHNSLVRDRRTFIKQLLELQEQTTSLDRFSTLDERVQTLATLSLAQSKQSRRFAHLLGSGDAIVAQQGILASRLEILNLCPVKELRHWTPLLMQRTTVDDSITMDSIHLCEV